MKQSIKHLTDITSIFHGQHRAGVATGNARVLSLTAIENLKAGFEMNALYTTVKAHDLLRDRDILLQSRGDSFPAFLYQEQMGPAVPSSLFLVIRADKTVILPEYLLFWLNAPAGQTLIRQVSKGTNLLSVSKKDISGLLISLPDYDTQQAIADALMAGNLAAEKAKQLYHTYQRLQQQLADKLIHNNI